MSTNDTPTVADKAIAEIRVHAEALPTAENELAFYQEIATFAQGQIIMVVEALADDEAGDEADEANVEKLTAAIEQRGGLDAFLGWCEVTYSDVLSTFDVTDKEWAMIRRTSEHRHTYNVREGFCDICDEPIEALPDTDEARARQLIFRDQDGATWETVTILDDGSMSDSVGDDVTLGMLPSMIEDWLSPR